jgi:hypothetical protein
MAIQCTECKLYKPNHEVRNGVCEDCYESSDDEDQIETSSSEDEAVSKTCTKCKITKELELFHKNKRKKDRRRLTCKECRRTPVKDSEFKTIDQSHQLCIKCNKIITKVYKYRYEKTIKHKNNSNECIPN